MIFSIVLAATAVYCIFNGIKTILTGTLSAKEEAQLKGFSEKGARSYKIAYAFMNILGGLLVAAFAVLRFLEEQKTIGDTLVLRLILLGVAVLMAVLLVVFRSKCKKMTDDE